MLGPEEFKPVASGYRAKLRSATEAKRQLASQPERQTPKFIFVVASPQNKQRHMEAVSGGIVVMLKSSIVKEYFGSAYDTVTTVTTGIL
jgi:hypothetical protein